jgi:hypothetical protein
MLQEIPSNQKTATRAEQTQTQPPPIIAMPGAENSPPETDEFMLGAVGWPHATRLIGLKSSNSSVQQLISGRLHTFTLPTGGFAHVTHT